MRFFNCGNYIIRNTKWAEKREKAEFCFRTEKSGALAKQGRRFKIGYVSSRDSGVGALGPSSVRQAEASSSRAPSC